MTLLYLVYYYKLGSPKFSGVFETEKAAQRCIDDMEDGITDFYIKEVEFKRY